jgi:hypothetical protein
MRVAFKYSQEDLVDATVRFAARSETLRRARRRNLFWSAVLLVSVSLLVRRVSFIAMVIAAVGALVVIIINPYLYDRRYRKTLTNLYKEKLGDQNEFTCEVELLPNGMKTSGEDCWATTEWNKIEEIVPTGDSVDIFGTHGGGCIVRNRAFNSAAERQRFIDLAQEYLNKSHGS